MKNWNKRIDAALAEKVEPVAWIVSEKGVGIRIHRDITMDKGVADIWAGICGLTVTPLYAAPADQWRRVEDGLPEVLFDGYSVFTALSDQAKTRTSAENVSDTLDAVVRLMRNALPEGE